MIPGSSVPAACIPHLSTAHLLLREPRLTDFAQFAANAADPVAYADIGGAIDSREAWRRFHAAAGHWQLQGMGWWVVEERELGPVGLVGVFRREWGPEVEIGWLVYRPHWGKGYASEAARAALDFAVGTVGTDHVVAYIAKRNAASVRVATKIGMRCRGEADFYGETCWLCVFER